MPRQPTIGKPVPRKEGRHRVTGRAQYVDDLQFTGMLHGATVRSDVPRGHVARIEFASEIGWREFVVVCDVEKGLPLRSRRDEAF